MSDWSTFFKSEAFKAYRKKQVQAVARVIDEGMCDAVVGGGGSGKLSRLDGQLDMARTMLKLPEGLTGDVDLANQLNQQLSEDMAGITLHLMRKRIEQ